MSDEILSVGEVLWDALPEGLFLGGAPFNVACHLQALGKNGSFASRVGDDRLGEEALRRMPVYGVETDLVQTDPSLPTGFVRVDLDPTGEPDYEIVQPVAWDAITLTDAVQKRAEHTQALVFGSLAQRSETSRQTLRQLWLVDAVRVFDVNLRPPHIDRDVIEDSLQAADIVKLNREELERIGGWLDLPSGEAVALEGLAATFDCTAVCLTLGKAGARLWQEGEYARHPGYDTTVKDTVGAGDAFLAAFLAGYLDGRRGGDLLDLANRLGAYVASHSGALPSYEADTLDAIYDLPLTGDLHGGP